MGETSVRSSGDNRVPMFGLDEEQQAILDQADRFARKELYPLCERMDRDEWWPEAAFPKIGDNGFFGVTIPEEYGGSGQDLLAAYSFTVVDQALRAHAPVPGGEGRRP